MSAPAGDSAQLDAALYALDYVADLVAEGRGAFDDSVDRRLALVYLWINIGSLLKQHCRHRGIANGTEPYAGPIKMRDKLAYGPLSALSADIVWDTCIDDGPRLRALLSELRATL